MRRFKIARQFSDTSQRRMPVERNGHNAILVDKPDARIGGVVVKNVFHEDFPCVGDTENFSSASGEERSVRRTRAAGLKVIVLFASR
jgi:hypothetical protein